MLGRGERYIAILYVNSLQNKDYKKKWPSRVHLCCQLLEPEMAASDDAELERRISVKCNTIRQVHQGRSHFLEASTCVLECLLYQLARR